MSTSKDQILVEELLAEFTEELRTTGTTNFSLVERCPSGRQRELRSLMNVAALMHWASDRAEERASRVRLRAVEEEATTTR